MFIVKRKRSDTQIIDSNACNCSSQILQFLNYVAFILIINNVNMLKGYLKKTKYIATTSI